MESATFTVEGNNDAPSLTPTSASLFLQCFAAQVRSMASVDVTSCEQSVRDPFPATDFRTFVDSLLEANIAGKRVVEVLALKNSVDMELPMMQQQQYRQEHVGIVEGLLAERRNLDAHYGWVLASDAQLVYGTMGGTSSDGAVWAKRWIKAIFEEYERVGQALAYARLKLRP